MAESPATACPSAPEVLVVGGGVVGCSVAFHLAREGVRVTLLERDDLAGQASGAAAGMLAPICESTGEGPFFELGLRSLAMFPDLAAELRDLADVDPQLTPSGVLRLASSEGEAQRLRRQTELLVPYGVEWIPPGEAREREPRLPAQICGALWSPREGHVYSPLLTRAYALAAERLGARIETGITVRGLLREGDRVTAVITTAGPRPAGHVVLCAGAWTRFIEGWPATPIEPVRGQILAIRSSEPPPRSILWDENVYLVPKLDGSLIAGATEEHVGFACETTVAGVAELLAGAVALLPVLADCAFLRAWAGLRPDTPDHLPAIGPVPGLEGLTVAAGHYRNGVLLSPITGRLVADWIVRRELSIPEAFLPVRFLS